LNGSLKKSNLPTLAQCFLYLLKPVVLAPVETKATNLVKVKQPLKVYVARAALVVEVIGTKLVKMNKRLAVDVVDVDVVAVAVGTKPAKINLLKALASLVVVTGKTAKLPLKLKLLKVLDVAVVDVVVEAVGINGNKIPKSRK
jgi:hypothetical protein